MRASKYRHVHGDKQKNSYGPVSRLEASGDGDHITASAKFFAYAGAGGGGPVVVHPINDFERMGASPPSVNVHKLKVIDMEFSPFYPNLLATGSEDCTAAIIQVPNDGLKEHIHKADATLVGHQKKVAFIHHHPVASNILGTSSQDKSIKIWDMTKQAEIFSMADEERTPATFAWNADGSQIAATFKPAKGQEVALFDPRSKETPTFIPVDLNPKTARVVWFSNHGLLGVVGTNTKNTRIVYVYDPKDLSKQLGEVEMGQGSGLLMTWYDPDTSILYLAGKGDGFIKYYEVVNEAPYLHFLTEFRDSASQKGVAFLPKTAVDVHKCEIAVCLRLMRDEVQSVSFQVPRKSDLFQEDIYPDTYAGVPGLTSDEWAEGKNADPQTRSMKPGTEVQETAAAAFVAQKSPAELQARIKVLEDLLKANNIDFPKDE